MATFRADSGIVLFGIVSSKSGPGRNCKNGQVQPKCRELPEGFPGCGVARLFASFGAGDLHFLLISAQHTAWLGTTKFLRRRRLGFSLRGLDCALKDDSKLIGLQRPWQEIGGSNLNGF